MMLCGEQMTDVDEELARKKKEYQMAMEEEQEGFVERLKGLRVVSSSCAL